MCLGLVPNILVLYKVLKIQSDSLVHPFTSPSMGELTNYAAYLLFSRASVSDQGGVISGENPAAYNEHNPIRLWIIQLVIIVGLTQLLAVVLSRLRQPRVIAEVIGGVLLGPSVMGRIPGFQENIFPKQSIHLLSLTASIGLILFLFLVALEIDTRLMKRKIVASASVSIAGLIIPLGLGAALGVGVYKQFISQEVNFGYFLLFVAVAVGITAFPVLCRILTELKLLDTEVGLVTLSAGIGNDVVGWILLALTVALVNASTGVTAVYVLLACAGYTAFLLYPGRWAFRWFAKRTGSLEQGSPTPLMMTVTLLIVFISAFFTDIIGVHAIFGGFLAGLIIPHDNGFAISFVEKLEDLVTIIFLPIYFTLSGLNTNLALLNDGIVWGYVVLICLVAFTSKFVACGLAAYLHGFNWREAGAIGSLMSCKGLVELIVLNIGLEAEILSPQTFSMFVVHALILTFATTPLVLLFYPSRYRIHLRGEKKVTGDETTHSSKPCSDEDYKTRFTVVLDKIEALPAAMTLSQLIELPSSLSTASESAEKSSESTHSHSASPMTIEVLRLIELTNRTSAVLRSQEADSLIHNDPIVSVFRTFGQLHNFSVSANLSVVNFSEFPDAIASHVAATSSQMVIIPWARGATSVLLEDETQSGGQQQPQGARNPFDGVFQKTTVEDQTSSIVYSEFIRNVFAQSPSDIALFVDRGASASVPAGASPQHIFLPFLGGPDDRLALNFLIQLCHRPSVTATVVRITKSEAPWSRSTSGTGGREGSAPASPSALLPHSTIAAADTIYGHHNTQTRMHSDTADNILWDTLSSPSQSSRAPSTAAALARIHFQSEEHPTPLRRITELARAEAAVSSKRTLLVVTGRSRRLAVEHLGAELLELAGELGQTLSSSVPKTLGDVGAALVATSVQASLLVLQAAPGAL